MRIGIDARLWNESGVGRYIRNLVKELSRIDKKNEYVLFVLSKDVESIKYQVLSIKNRNIKIVKADIRWHTITEQIRFPKVIKKEHVDLMHFPYFSVPLGYDDPFVVTIHDLINYHYPTGKASTLPLPIYRLKHFGYKRVIRHAARDAVKIITPLEATKKDVIETLGVLQRKVVVTHEGFDSSIKSGTISSRLKEIVGNTSYFLYVGNAYPHKNLTRMLNAFVNFKFQISNFKFILVGKEDHFYRKLKQGLPKDLHSSVIILHDVSDSELFYLYKSAKALIYPSLMEGFGLPALEAMSLGCLVLASNIPALREVCGQAAIYFDPLSTKDIADKLNSVCLNVLKHLNKNIESGLDRSRAFSWEKMARETLDVYNSI